MADGSMVSAPSLRGKVSEAEWQARVDLAALYRLVALYGWDDLIFTHISARIPGPEHHFLINPYGLFFEEMTASALVKIDLDGEIIHQSGRLHHPLRGPRRTRRRQVRHAPAFRSGRGGFGPERGAFAPDPACADLHPAPSLS